MSLIFDALKKAESERARQSGPVLMDVRIAPRRQHLPAWAWALGCVLLANLLFLAWLVLRPDTKPAATTASTAASVNSATPPTAAAPPAAPVPATPGSVAPPPAAPLPLPNAAPIMPPATTIAAEQPGIDNLPTMQDLIAGGVTLPALQLNLHVYDEVTGNRYVLLNSKRLREGDALSDGIRVERITPRGVVLNAGGHRFLLIAGG